MSGTARPPAWSFPTEVRFGPLVRLGPLVRFGLPRRRGRTGRGRDQGLPAVVPRRERPGHSTLERFALRAATEARSRRAAVLEVSVPDGPNHRNLFGSCYHAVVVTPRVDGGGVLAPPTVLPVPPGRFGVVLCTEVVPRCQEPREVLSELRRVLEPDGRVYVSTSLVVPERRAGAAPWPPDEGRFGLNYLMEAAGLRIEDVTPLSDTSRYGVVAGRRDAGPGMDRPPQRPIR